MNNTKKKGFTLIELVIVIAVIGILAAVLIPTFTSVIGDARESSAAQSAKSAYTAYLMDTVEDGSTEYIVVVVGDYVFVTNNGNMVNITECEESTDTTIDGVTYKLTIANKVPSSVTVGSDVYATVTAVDADATVDSTSELAYPNLLACGDGVTVYTAAKATTTTAS